jgi:2-amino-4-hydroxy-6-hydroxymethyldihydropteridine diphosphokinase
MTEVYLLLGTNMGERIANIVKAVTAIGSKVGKVSIISAIYETAAWGKTDQDSFLNLAILVSTFLAPIDLLHELKTIEKEVGRTDTEKWGPRVIDIDIIFYGSELIQQPELQIPHPYLPVRRFALLPLSDIAIDFIHPLLKKSVKELLAECPDQSEVRVYSSADELPLI